MKINKCSLTGIAVNIDADNPYELLEQTSYYPVNFYELGADDYYNNGWYPSKITFSVKSCNIKNSSKPLIDLNQDDKINVVFSLLFL